MASTTGPDLSAGKAAVESLQDDSCIITRGTKPSVLNDLTGKVETPPDAIIYDVNSVGEGGRSLADADATGGRCAISVPSNARPSYREQGGRQILTSSPEAKIPIDAPVVKEGDFLMVLSSRRDPQLVGQQYRVAEVVEKTMAISRRLVLERP